VDAQPRATADLTRTDPAPRVVGVDGSVAFRCVVHAPSLVLVVRTAARQSPARSTLVDSAAST
jgi:hypothetical protein